MLPNMAHFEVHNCFLQDMSHFALVWGKKSFWVILSYFFGKMRDFFFSISCENASKHPKRNVEVYVVHFEVKNIIWQTREIW